MTTGFQECARRACRGSSCAADFRGGDLISSPAAEGLAPSDVDTVFFTHLHHDHVGWVSDVAPAPSPRTRSG
ncbi:MBL fold metallo-hydrolase [Actinokineospora xionganensis]|uniref:MBL fold metallo-hydrolase n=1 Tax=Actinokineospora xionganensis TaxID=2684470 RepID=UPI001C9BDE90